VPLDFEIVAFPVEETEESPPQVPPGPCKSFTANTLPSEMKIVGPELLKISVSNRLLPLKEHAFAGIINLLNVLPFPLTELPDWVCMVTR